MMTQVTQMGAARFAPYEYYLARSYWEQGKAQHTAAEFDSALRYFKKASFYAGKARATTLAQDRTKAKLTDYWGVSSRLSQTRKK